MNEKNETNIIEALENIAIETKEQYNIQNIEELKYLHNLIDIILNNNSIVFNEYETDYVKTSKSIKYAYEFLKSIDKSYGQIFIDAYNKEEIKVDISNKKGDQEYKIDENTSFIDESRLSKFNPSLYYDYIDDAKFIDIPMNGDIADAVALVHEFIHYLTINKNNFDKPGISMFSETPSIASEYLFEKQHYGTNGVHKIGTLNLKVVKLHARNSKIKLMLFEQILEDGELDFIKFTARLGGLSDDDLMKILYNILVNRDMFITGALPYIAGSILAMDSFKDLNDLRDCIEILKENPISLYQHFNLDLNETFNELSDETKKRLQDNLKNGIDERNKLILKTKYKK